MAKRFLKQPVRSESDDAGCLSGFISIFDFHVGHNSQKLLSDRKHWSSRGLETGYSRKKLDFPSDLETKLEVIDDGDERRAKRGNSSMVSVKTLMEEEMSKTHNTNIQNTQLERSQSESGLEIHIKGKNKKKIKKRNVVPDHHVNDVRCSSNLDFCQYNSANPTKRSSATNDLAAFMVQFYCDIHHYKGQSDFEIDSCPLSGSIAHRKKIHHDETDSQLSGKYLTLQKALGEVAKVILNQKLVDSKEPASNEAIQSREFIDALEILTSNKELFVKLIQDRNLPLLKHIQDIQHALVGANILGEEASPSEQLEHGVSSELFQKQSRHKFFRKKDKPKGSDSSQDTSKIVVLEPSPAIIQNDSVTQYSLSSSPLSHHSLKHREEGERTKSYFSLKGIKRRLRHVMGENRKDRHPITMDGVLDRIPYGFKDASDTQKSFVLTSETSCNYQQTSQPSAVGKKRDKSKLKIENPPCRESFFYEEAKKHLAEMVATRDEKDSSPTVSESLGRIVSLPEYNLLSPRFSPGRDEELELSPRKIILSPSRQFNRGSPMGHLSPLRQSLDQDSDIQITDSDLNCIAEDLKPKESMEIVEASDIKPLEEHDDLDVPPESIGNEPDVICEGCVEQGSSALLEMETPVNKPQFVIPSLSVSSSFLQREKLENPGDTLEKPEGPSPVSVLEPFVLEDIISPGSTTSDHVDLPIQPQQIDIQELDDSTFILSSSDFEGNAITRFDEKEAMYVYITTLLQGSGMSCSRILERRISSDQFLDPSLLEEVEILHSLLPDDPKLLFDCINEVLAEIQERLFDCNSWISLFKPSTHQAIMRGTDLIEEVCKGIDRHLQLSEFTLDQIDMKDLEGRSGMDLRCQVEAIVIDMSDAIFEDIMEETMSKQ